MHHVEPEENPNQGFRCIKKMTLELGLHPYALNVIASLFRAVSHHAQVLVSTQSSAFLDNFAPEDIVVVERNGEATEFDRPDADQLDTWLEEYSLGEIWEKNVIGGGPR